MLDRVVTKTHVGHRKYPKRISNNYTEQYVPTSLLIVTSSLFGSLCFFGFYVFASTIFFGAIPFFFAFSTILRAFSGFQTLKMSHFPSFQSPILRKTIRTGQIAWLRFNNRCFVLLQLISSSFLNTNNSEIPILPSKTTYSNYCFPSSHRSLINPSSTLSNLVPFIKQRKV